MRQIKNEIYTDNSIGKNDIFICVFGYEKRSLYLFEKIRNIVKNENILVFYFDDYKDSERINTLKKNGFKCIEETYNSEQHVQKNICDFVKTKSNNTKDLVIHIDYSSMPRNWYYNLPMLLNQPNLKVYFWYVVGTYPIDYTAYPTAGIDSYTIIGKPSLKIEGKRLHVFGLSYDSVRTKALISEIDPDSYITCNAFAPNSKERREHVNSLNEQILSKAINELSFNFDDFSFMFSKLCEIANEYSNKGSVIFVPDGPKPLIFAMSLVVLSLNKEGVLCLHVYRNEQCMSSVNVEPTNTVLGFSVQKIIMQ